MDEDDPGMDIALGSGCHPCFFAAGLFFPDDNDTVDGAERAGVRGDGIDRGAAA